MTSRLAITDEPTTALHHTGHGFTLPAGTYEVVEIDGADDDRIVYITGPDGDLCGLNPHDPAVTFADDDQDVES